MTDEETIQKLLDLKLATMANAFRDLLTEPPGNQRSFTEKIAHMVDREWADRDNRRLARLLRVARLTITDASLENVWCEPGRGLDKTLVRDLATCNWIRNKHNVIIVGKTGVGKSYLGAALAQAACRKGLRAMCTRVPRLAHELAIARADGTYTALLARLARLEVLVLDDFLIAPLKDTERRDLLEVLEDRYGTSSTVVTSQVPTKTWHEMLADPTIADAICDRLVHNAHVIALKGPSGREKKGLQIESPQPTA
jgi:DNA replication protein DnaC